jgi:multidrug efflux system outer membrane protein
MTMDMKPHLQLKYKPVMRSIPKKISLLLLAGALLALEGCLVGGKMDKPVVSQTPEQFPQFKGNVDTLTVLRWFEIYQDTVLQRLIRTTIDSNRNLMIAAARVEQSREIAGFIKANLYPQLGYSAQAGGGQAGTEAQKVAGGLDKGVFKGFATLNWEIDLWGRIRHANLAFYNEYLADIDNRNALLVSLVAEVANQYFVLCDLDNRLAIARRTLTARQESTRIIAERFAKGYVAEVDKLQAEQQEALAAVTIPAFERQIITIENSLRILMGMGPGRIPRGQTLYQQQISPEIPAGLPSQLLLRRPDIREAERRLEAAFNRIGVAKASLYPALNLTGLLGFASPSLTTFLGSSGFVANGFANLAGPIFQWGQNKRRIRITQYQNEQAFRNYELTVLTAFGDVDNALAQYRTYSQEYEVRHQLVMAARKALELTEAKYNYGYSSYYEVLIQQNYLFDAELAESTTLQQKINSLVFLYKSLGGGWQ